MVRVCVPVMKGCHGLAVAYGSAGTVAVWLDALIQHPLHLLQSVQHQGLEKHGGATWWPKRRRCVDGEQGVDCLTVSACLFLMSFVVSLLMLSIFSIIKNLVK